jgi:hypothetical protein
VAQRTPTAEQQAQLKRQSDQLAALDAEEKRLYSEDYQKTLTPQQYDKAAVRLDELTAQRAELSRSQNTLAAQAYGVDPASLRRGESVTFTTQDGLKVSVGGTGVESRNAAARANNSADDYETGQIRSETAGPRVTRTQTTTTSVTGGGQRVTEMTPEMKSWTEKNSQASKLDESAQRDAFLRSQGLENADKGTQLKAITKARNQYDADGNSTFDKYKSNSNKAAVGPPPAEQYKTTNIPVNDSGEETINDGRMSADTTAKQSARGQTAEQKLQNTETPNQPGSALSAEEKAKLDQSKTGELSNKAQQSQDPTATNKQNTEGGTDKKKSEADFDAGTGNSNASSVVGKDVSGNSSDFSTASKTFVLPKNKLHDYTSYTYRITLFLLTAKDFNALANNPKTFVPTFSLISSGAGFATPGAISTETTRKTTPWGGVETVATPQTKAGRHPDFQTDFFIDGLSMKTVVGLNAKSKASNAIEIAFNITEPYGLSLLDRLLSACETCGDNNPNYMEQPYLLQIDLLASPTDEQLTRLKQTNNVIDSKKIAIKLLEMKIKPSGSGSTYALTAMPYNHTAFSLSNAAMPVAMNVEASTVGEFFSSTEDLAKLFAGEIKSQEERLESDLKKWVEDFNRKSTVEVTPEQIENQRRVLAKALKFSSKSLTAAFNTYMDKISKEQKLSKLPPTKIAFNIPDNIIANSPIVDDTAQTTDTRMPDKAASVGTADPQQKKTQSFAIHPGTSVLDVIDMVMGKSDYVKNQIKTQAKENNTQAAQDEYTNGKTDRDNSKKNVPMMKWYKVIPTVALNDFDASRNAYSKTILYSILPYAAANAYHPNFPKASKQSLQESVVREYNYFYTGKNQDITRLDIDFDSTFYTALTTYRNQVARLGSNRLSDPGEIPDSEFSTNAVAQQTNPPTTIVYHGSNKNSNSMNTSTNPKEKVVSDLKQSLYTSSRGDALNIKLQIIGDPDFIKQDDIFFNPGSPEEYAKLLGERFANSTAPISSSGQILFDAEQVNVRVQFKNSVDIDDTTGIVNKQEKLTNGRTTDGTFSGIYKVLTVESNFSRGEFTQTLDLVRIPETLPEVPVVAPKTTQSGVSTDTQSSKQNEDLDASKKSAISANPAGVAPTPQPKLAEAAAQPAVNGQGGPENANNNQAVAPQASAGLTFPEAFRQARKDFGNKPGGVFEWRGKLYQTNYQNEPYVKNPTPVYPGANQ